MEYKEKKTWLEGMQKQYEPYFPHPYPYPCRCNQCPCCGGYRHVQLRGYYEVGTGTNPIEYGRDYA